MSFAQVIIYVCLPLAVGVWAWFRFRKRRNLRAKQHASCDCDAVIERAKVMNELVDSKIREIDSRDPDKSAYVVPSHESPTEEVKPLDDTPRKGKPLPPDHDSQRGAMHIGAAVGTLALLFTFLAGFYCGGHVRDRVHANQAVGGNAVSNTPADRIPDGRRSVDKDCLTTDAKLAELRHDPRAATHFKYCSIDDSRRAEVIEALRVAAMCDDAYHAAAAQDAIRRWE